MGFWLICLGTNLLPPECKPWRSRIPGTASPTTVDALSHIAVGWSRTKRRLRHEIVSVQDMMLPGDPGLRQHWLRAWASEIRRVKPALVTSVGGRYFAPYLRRMYLQEDHPYPDLLDIPPIDAPREAHQRNLHVDFAQVLNRATMPDLPTFLEAAGLPATQARAAVGSTAEGSLLRTVAAFHLAIRFLAAIGELGTRERREAEDTFFYLIEGFGSQAAAVSRTLCNRSARPEPS
jgi:hypothetical protein